MITALALSAALMLPMQGPAPLQHATNEAGKPLWSPSSPAVRESTPRKTRAAEWLRLARHYRDSAHPEVWRGVPKWIRDLGLCIRRHESKHDYRAHNKSSSAAGGYQMLDAFWQGNARWATWQGKRVAARYKAANHAPAWIQDVVFIHSIKRGGASAWRGTGCPGT